MSDGAKAYYEDEREKYYKENHKKHEKAIEDYINSDKFKRLVELRIMFKEYREWMQLEEQAKIVIQQNDTVNWCDNNVEIIRTKGIKNDNI